VCVLPSGVGLGDVLDGRFTPDNSDGRDPLQYAETDTGILRKRTDGSLARLSSIVSFSLRLRHRERER
jgi:hypothetical protein